MTYFWQLQFTGYPKKRCAQVFRLNGYNTVKTANKSFINSIC